MKVGIIGYGNIGRMHADAISTIENAQLTAVADGNLDNLALAKSKWGCETFADYKEMLKSDIELVTVCTPPSLHCQMVMDAAAAGKHVIVEKPMAPSLEQADQMIAACDKAGVKLGVIFQHRFDSDICALKKAMDAGRFGRILMGESRVLWYRDDEYYNSCPWRKKTAEAGGVLQNQAIHYLDLMLYFLGEPEAVSAVSCRLGRNDVEIDNTGISLVRFKDEKIGTVTATVAAYPGICAQLALICENGSAIFRDDRLVEYHLKEGTAPELENLSKEQAQTGAAHTAMAINYASHAAQIRDMVDAISEDRKPMVDGREGRRVIALIDAIYASSRDGVWTDCK